MMVYDDRMRSVAETRVDFTTFCDTFSGVRCCCCLPEVHARHRDRRCSHLEEKHVTVSFPTQRDGMITNTNWYTLSLRTFELFNGEFEIMHAFSCEYVTYLDTILLFGMKCDHNTI